ncbi:protein of unknown function [Magnetospirillum sp. XM-1]|nr:protein of unknown function [Magnetospirillum sp. XM-1]
MMDASGSPSDISEEFSRQRMHDAGVVLTATNTLMAEIAQDWFPNHLLTSAAPQRVDRQGCRH